MKKRIGERPAAAVAAGMLALAIAGVLTACGEDDDKQGLSKKEYIARSGAICVSNGQKADALNKRLVQGEPRTPATAHRFIRAVVPVFRDSVKRRSELPAPEGDENKIRALNAAGEEALSAFKRIAATPSRSADLMLGKAPDPAKDYDARSRRYGIAKCGGD